MPKMEDVPHRRWLYNHRVFAIRDFVSKSTHFLSRQARHNRNPRYICWSAAEAEIGASYIDERSLCNFRELPEADTKTQQDPRDRFQYNQESPENLSLNVVAHGRLIY